MQTRPHISDVKQPLIIRPVRPEDGPALYQIISHPDVARTMLQLPSIEYRETEQWINNHNPGHHRLIALKDGSAIGSVSLMQPQRPRSVHSGKIGIMVHPDHWGSGVGTALMESIVDLADNWLNLLRIELTVLASNTRAVALYRKFGFELEGIKRESVISEGKFLDEYVMARLRDPLPSVERTEVPEFHRRTDVIDIIIRPLQVEDADSLHSIISNPIVARSLNQIPSIEVIDVQKKITDGGPGLFRYSAVAAHADGSTKVVGNVTLHQPQNPRLFHSGSLGISVHPDYWGIGVGKRLLSTIVDLADNWIKLKRIELEVYTINKAAIHLYEQFGFEIEGTKRFHNYGDGRWNDAHFMARVNSE